MNPITRGLQAWCYAVSQREHFVVATAALVVGLESQVPSIYKKQIVPLREVYKFTEDEIEFFDLHITSDVVHGERGYQIVLDHADTPQLQQRCLQLVRWGAEMRFSYTKGLYDTTSRPTSSPRPSSPSRGAPVGPTMAHGAPQTSRPARKESVMTTDWIAVATTKDLARRRKLRVELDGVRRRVVRGRRDRYMRSPTPASIRSVPCSRAPC